MEYNVLVRRVAVESVSEKYQVDSGYDAIGKECLKNNIKVKQIMMPEIRKNRSAGIFQLYSTEKCRISQSNNCGERGFCKLQ